MYSKENKYYTNIIKSFDYKMSQDQFGWYFEKDGKKFSIIKNIPVYSVYYNKQENDNWVLKNSKQSVLTINDCLAWITQIIQRNL